MKIQRGFAFWLALCAAGALLGAGVSGAPVSPPPQQQQQHIEQPLHLQTAPSFAAFKQKYNKVYNSEREEAVRARVFAENLLFITRHNLEYKRGKHTHTVGINEFADLSWKEFATTFLQVKPHQRSTDTGTPTLRAHTVLLPDINEQTMNAHDWRTQAGVVTPVSSQRRAPEGWAHAAVGAVESARAIAGGMKLGMLSTQELLDCTLTNTEANTKGMDPATALVYAREHGLTARDDYVTHINTTATLPKTTTNTITQPNNSAKTHSAHQPTPTPSICHARGLQVMASVDDIRAVHASEGQLRAAVTQQPVSVMVQVPGLSLMFYESGVFSDLCAAAATNTQAMLAVGYNTSAEGVAYWILKNSWGENWGEHGYLLLARHRSSPSDDAQLATDGLCGVHRNAVYPTIPSPHYQQPSNTNTASCLLDESPLMVAGLTTLSDGSLSSVTGHVCAPRCSSTFACPTDAFPGGSVTSQCMLDSTGAVSTTPTHCALLCESSNLSRTQCPVGASCVHLADDAAAAAATAVGVCVFV